MLCFGVGKNKKAAKGSLTKDEEGDFYPEEFLQKHNEFTREEEAPYLNNNLGLNMDRNTSFNKVALRPDNNQNAFFHNAINDDFANIVSVEEENYINSQVVEIDQSEGIHT